MSDVNEYGVARKQHEALEGVMRLAATGEIPVGEYFSADDIAERLDVSRTPVREAITALAFGGVVEVVPQVGTKLLLPSKDEITQFNRINSHAERNAVWAIKSSDDLLTDPAIGVAFDAVEKSVEQEDPDVDAFLRVDTDFHRTLCDLGGETAAAQVMRLWGLKRRLYQVTHPGLSAENIRLLAKTDKAIVTNIREGVSGVGQSAVDGYYSHLRRVE